MTMVYKLKTSSEKLLILTENPLVYPVLFHKSGDARMKNAEIIFKDSQGNIIKREDLLNISGKVNYEIIGTENISKRTIELHQKARVYGQSGNYIKAIELLEEAHRTAPTWPYPLYDLAFTYLLKKDFSNALLNYEKV